MTEDPPQAGPQADRSFFDTYILRNDQPLSDASLRYIEELARGEIAKRDEADRKVRFYNELLELDRQRRREQG